jgi:hypothetical protein
MPTLTQRIRSGWNAFIGRDPTKEYQFVPHEFGYSYGGIRPDRMRYTGGNQRSIVASVYNRISVDVASINFEHAKLDDNGHFKESMKSGLNECMNVSANIDQTGRAFLQDIVESMFDEGVVAIVPVETDVNPINTESYDIRSMRTGRIVAWYPEAVKVHLYNELRGRYQDIIMPKSRVAIIENPFYSIMNEPNSTLQRLIAAINKLNAANDNSTSSKLDLIIQLPYVTKSPQRKEEARKRRAEIEDQLSNSKLGIAYTDGTERVTQLNRSLDNNLWTQVKELTEQLFSQLGVTPSILDGTADEATRINYFNSTIAPICSAICDEFGRKFLTKTARTQKQAIIYFRDPFKLVPVSQLADIADKFRRNEIMTSNELRAEIGYKPSDAAQANDISNPNLNKSDAQLKAQGLDGMGAGMNEATDSNSSEIDGLLQSIGNQSI